METEDPRAALTDRKVAIRAAGARDLGRMGTWEDFARLVELGWKDPSLAVRLHAAGAAADWVGARRGAQGQEQLSPAQQAQVMSWALSFDPGTNPSMLMLLAAAPVQEALTRLGRVLRDPRGDVRLGVVTAVRRMVLSAVADPEPVAAALKAWLAEDRVPPDTRSELARIAGEAGLPALRPELLLLRRTLPELAALLDGALDRLDDRLRGPTWTGPWRSEGLDVFELGDPRADDLLLVGGDAWVEPDRACVFSLVDGHGDVDGGRVRMVWATPLGSAEPRAALQHAGRTWWRLDAPTAVTRVEESVPALRALGAPAASALAAWVSTLQPMVGERLAGISAWLSGDLQGAERLLGEAIEKKKAPPELSLWRAHVRVGLGRVADAHADAQAFLDRAPKSSDLRTEAESLLAT